MLLIACMMLALLPTAVFAGSTQGYGIEILGQPVDDENCDDVLGDGGSVKFAYDNENDKGVLTLTDATIAAGFLDDTPIEAADMDCLEIVLKGKSTIRGADICITACDLFFSGDGSLVFDYPVITDPNDAKKIYTQSIDCGNLTVNSGNITMVGVENAIWTNSVSVSSGTLVCTSSNDAAIGWFFNGITITLGSDRIMVTSENSDGTDAVVTEPNDNTKISAAKYVKIFYKYVTVSIVTDDSSDPDTMNAVYGNPIDKPAVPTKDGYKFDGWYTDPECTMPYDFETKVTEPVTLYAKWTKDEQPAIDLPWWAGLLPVLDDELPFADVNAGDWFYDDVRYVYENGLTNGTGAAEFRPNAAVTRGMVLTILARNEGVDTSGTPWYAAGRDWAVANGISDGTNMEAPVTREQLAAMLYRYASFKGRDAAAPERDLSAFPDAGSISGWALEAMRWAVDTNLISGSNGNLRPQGTATRAELAALLSRFLG